MVTVPAATPATRPVGETVAVPVALLDQVTTRPVSTLPAESLVTTLSWSVAPMFTLPGAGETMTIATGASVTVMADVPLLPSLVAVIVADPAPTAVTNPLAETVATPGALLDQVTIRPVRTLPAESFVVAVSCAVAPTMRLVGVGDTVTVATGTRLTVTEAVPLLPSLLAVMFADPAATAVTMPFADTVATEGASLDQVTARPFSTLPAASFIVAANCSDAPGRNPAEPGVTVTAATGTTATLIDAVPLCPSLVAVIVAEPTANAPTTPLAETVATLGALLDQVIWRPLRMLPAASRSVAVSCVLPLT